MRAGDGDYTTREGYAANKVAAEQVLLESGGPVTVLRPSKIHGPGARRPREWVFVKRVLDRRPAVFLAHRGAGVDHHVGGRQRRGADRGRCRPAGPADPQQRRPRRAERARDRPHGRAAASATPGTKCFSTTTPATHLGSHPWDAPHPIVLDTDCRRRSRLHARRRLRGHGRRRGRLARQRRGRWRRCVMAARTRRPLLRATARLRGRGPLPGEPPRAVGSAT